MIELKITADQPADLGSQILGFAALISAGAVAATAIVDEQASPAETATRERGKPAPGSGRSRRTKEEIAEDEAAEKAEQNAQPVAEAEPETVVEPMTEAGPEKVEAGPEKVETAVTRDEVRSAIVAEAAKLDQSKRQEFVQSLLKPFGVSKLGDLPEAKLPDLMAAVKAGGATDSALD